MENAADDASAQLGLAGSAVSPQYASWLVASNNDSLGTDGEVTHATQGLVWTPQTSEPPPGQLTPTVAMEPVQQQIHAAPQSRQPSEPPPGQPMDAVPVAPQSHQPSEPPPGQPMDAVRSASRSRSPVRLPSATAVEAHRGVKLALEWALARSALAAQPSKRSALKDKCEESEQAVRTQEQKLRQLNEPVLQLFCHEGSKRAIAESRRLAQSVQSAVNSWTAAVTRSLQLQSVATKQQRLPLLDVLSRQECPLPEEIPTLADVVGTKWSDDVIAKAGAVAEPLLAIWGATGVLSMGCNEFKEAAECFRNAALMVVQCSGHPGFMKFFGAQGACDLVAAASQAILEQLKALIRVGNHQDLMISLMRKVQSLLELGVADCLAPQLSSALVAASCSYVINLRKNGLASLAEEALSAAATFSMVSAPVRGRFLRQSALVALSRGQMEHAVVSANEAVRVESYDINCINYARSLLVLLFVLRQCSKAGQTDKSSDELEAVAEAFISHSQVPVQDRLKVCRQLGQNADGSVISKTMYLGCIESLVTSRDGEDPLFQLQCVQLFAEAALNEASDASAPMRPASDGLCRILNALRQGKDGTPSTCAPDQMAPLIWKLTQVSFQNAEFEETTRWLTCFSKLVGKQKNSDEALALVHWRAGNAAQALQQMPRNIDDNDLWWKILRFACSISMADGENAQSYLKAILEHEDFSAQSAKSLAIEVARIPASLLLLECLQVTAHYILRKRNMDEHAETFDQCCHEIVVRLALVAESCCVPPDQLAACLDLCIKSFSCKDSIGTNGTASFDSQDSRRFLQQSLAIAWRNGSKLFHQGNAWVECVSMLERAWELLHLVDGGSAVEGRIRCALLLARARLASIAQLKCQNAMEARKQAAEQASHALIAARQNDVPVHAEKYVASLAEVEWELRLGVPHSAEVAVGIDDPSLTMKSLWRMAVCTMRCPRETSATTRCLWVYLRRALISSQCESSESEELMQRVGAALRSIVALQNSDAAKLHAFQDILAWLRDASNATLNAIHSDVVALGWYSWNLGTRMHKCAPEKARQWLEFGVSLFCCLPFSVYDNEHVSEVSRAMEWCRRAEAPE